MFETGDSMLSASSRPRTIPAWNVKCLARDDKIARGWFPKSSGTHKSSFVFPPEAIACLRLQSNDRLLIFR
jgi:hypothetical protein